MATLRPPSVYDSLATADPQNIGTTGSALASDLLGFPNSEGQELGETVLRPAGAVAALLAG